QMPASLKRASTAPLTDRLDQLKAAVPSAETSSGYVRTHRRSSLTYVSVSTIYTNPYPSYYSSYSVFHTKEKSSSPDSVRSVSGIVKNATLEDINQRIDALQHTISTWTRRTSTMSLNGISGIMRDANEAYLEGLKGYTQDFIDIRKSLRQIEQAQAHKAQNKAGILQNWKNFETTRLSILKSDFDNNDLESIEPFSERTYTLNESQLAPPPPHPYPLMPNWTSRLIF
ncbi:MAG: hypothetical protein ACI9JZ_001650, partial [Lentimonas sp.]